MTAPEPGDFRPRWWARLRRLPLASVGAVALGCAVVAVLAVSSPDIEPLDRQNVGAVREPAPLPPPPVRVDRSNWAGAPVPAAETGPVAVVGGDTTLTGVVRDPGGQRVGGAVVSLTRFLGSSSSSVTVAADDDGVFVLPQAVGGRWRAVAWQPPQLPPGRPSAVFVDQGSTHRFDLVTADRVPDDVEVTVAVDNGDQAVVAVKVTATVVADDGRTQVTPAVVDEVTFVWPQGYDGPDRVAAFGGEATATATCDPRLRSRTPAVVAIEVSGQVVTVTLDGCQRPEPSTTTTTTTTTSTTTTLPPSTTTTQPPPSTTTTVPPGDR